MMQSKPKIKEAILVEGRYDKNTLSQIIQAEIIESGGFQIYKDREIRNYIRQTAQEIGLIVLTDSDAAGFQIRNEIHNLVPAAFLLDAYIPPIYGKEHRKERPGKEGLLGVEGMPPAVLLSALADAGATFLSKEPSDSQQGQKGSEAEPIQVSDLYAAGITGNENSALRKSRLLSALHLPVHMNTKSLLTVLNRKMDRGAFFDLCAELEEKTGSV